MAEIVKTISKESASDFILTSVGACVAAPTKKLPPKVIIAYRCQNNGEISYLSADLPKKGKLYTKNDILALIKTAENAKNATYVDARGKEKDVYFCRPVNGSTIDVVSRDYEKNCYNTGFAEIASSGVKFSVDLSGYGVFKSGKAFNVDIVPALECKYEKDSYEYALVNAFNACLFGSLFESDELQIETRDGESVKIEVRLVDSDIINENVLYIRPIIGTGDVVDRYVTEEFNFIDGELFSTRKYEITYSNRFKAYRLTRV